MQKIFKDIPTYVGMVSMSELLIVNRCTCTYLYCSQNNVIPLYAVCLILFRWTQVFISQIHTYIYYTRIKQAYPRFVYLC